MGSASATASRIKAQIREEGVKGAIHGNRGRNCNRKLPINTHRHVVELARGKYRGFNDHHLSEKLADEEGMKISREKVRRVLRAQGFPSPRNRRPPRHRSCRQRRGCEGMMLQVDGSPHDWLEGREPYLTLVGAIDDATEMVPEVFFVEVKSSWSYLKLFFIGRGDRLIIWQQERCGKSEEVHKVMKEDLAGGNLPSGDFGENAAWWLIMVLSLNLNVIMKRLVYWTRVGGQADERHPVWGDLLAWAYPEPCPRFGGSVR